MAVSNKAPSGAFLFGLTARTHVRTAPQALCRSGMWKYAVEMPVGLGTLRGVRNEWSHHE